MAEDDRFSKCMGKGYKTAYLHARDGHSETVVARTLAKGISHHLRSGTFNLTALSPIIVILENAITDVQNRRGELFHPTEEVCVSYHRALDRVLISHDASTSTKALCEAARQTFESLHRSDSVLSPQIRSAFCEKLMHVLADHWCFAVPVNGVTARQEIMRKNQRGELDQMIAEQKIESLLVSWMGRLIKSAMRSKDGKPRRTPPLPKLPPRFNFSEMHQPLADPEAK